MVEKEEITVTFSDAAEMAKWVDASYQLMPREILGIEKKIQGVIRQQAIAQKIFPTVPIPKGLRQYAVATEDETEAPRFDDNFNREHLLEVRKSEATFYPVFMHADFSLNMVDIQAGENQWYNRNLLDLTVSGITGTIADYKEKVIWRGYDISGRAVASTNRQGSIDANSVGILNTTNVQAVSAGAGGDSDVQAAGDGPATISQHAEALINYNFYGPYDFIMTPYVYAQLLLNMNSTTHITDIERMQSMVDLKGNKVLRNIDITKYLINTAESSGASVTFMFDRKTPAGEPTCVIGEEFPISYHPITRSRLGTSGKIIWAGIPLVLRPYAFTIDAAVTA